MPTFELKLVNVPLFGVVEAQNKAPWFKAFAAAGVTVKVELDDAALDVIADELEIDAVGLASDAERYANGLYRPKARGIGGSRLGDLGEIITFLVNRTAPSRKIIRVVSWRARPGQTVKGSRFPQPDFIVSDAGGAAALEVKSTEAFDFVRLRDATKRWRWLQPCSSVAGCRDEALPQLAFVKGTLTPQQHSLVVRDGRVVPFPVGKGIATAVVAVDGRTEILRSDARFKTPKTCRQASRDCWSCVPSACHFVLITMPNAPGMLSLGGGAEDGSAHWLRKYERWSQAVVARDLLAVRDAVGALGEVLEAWLHAPGVIEADVLRGFWGSYLGDAMRSRGLNVEVPESLGSLADLDWDFGWAPTPIAEPTSGEVRVDDLAGILSRYDGQLAPFQLSAKLQSAERRTETLSVRGDADFVDFYLISSAWWTGGQLETTDDASSIAARLVSTVSEVLGMPSVPRISAIFLREVVAKVGEHTVRLGWVPRAPPAQLGAFDEWIHEWLAWCVGDRWTWPPWQCLLLCGDPRVQLRVAPDGRARLRMARTLLLRGPGSISE